MKSPAEITALVVWGGFALAFIFGFVAQRSHFCTMGAVSDIVLMGSWTRMRMWLLAIAVAVLGAGFVYAMGWVDLTKTIYTRPRFVPLSHLVGGFLFGYGMVLASGCGNKTLVRIGGGNLKSLIVLVFLGVSAYMTLRGLFGVWRVNTLDAVAIDFAARGIASQDLPVLLSSTVGIGVATLRWALPAVIGGALLVFVFKDREFRSSADSMLAGIVIGAVIIAAWYLTGHLGYGENPDTLENTFFGTNSKLAESLSFVAPAAYGLELLMLWSDKSLTLTFGIATMLGVVAGAAAYALASRTFRWEGFASIADLRNHIVGGILMGFGGVTALGCTIGQGITGVSTLALGSLITLGAIIAGAWTAVKVQLARVEAA